MSAATNPATNPEHPFFVRVWKFMSSHETEWLRDRRRENLDGLTGRVLEVGAGTGTNFACYPATVTEVLAVEPEPQLYQLARRAAAAAPVPVRVLPSTVEALDVDESFDAVVCSLVLCSVGRPDDVLRQLYALLRPGGELRYFEHVASTGARGVVQQLADATVWPRLFANCHTHRDTEQLISAAGFQPARSRRDLQFPVWLPLPVAEVALGCAHRPA